eukprot:CAMPEP_0185275594 /NCGR_PEP_ID=MMETSP1359-20130426/54312_1 /TAXON_ID=552665 /ORGANISM="Bigelowiella longifila, Strain CCMP242" /LENGTH=259 /DNA_ID=CAMNT_0027868989 /DNA_START=27 /DNA_END=806 /DNA_ORIENTATION=-
MGSSSSSKESAAEWRKRYYELKTQTDLAIRELLVQNNQHGQQLRNAYGGIVGMAAVGLVGGVFLGRTLLRDKAYIKRLVKRGIQMQHASTVEEVDAVRSRLIAESERSKKFAIQKFSSEVLEVVDNLERAASSEESSEGVKMTLKALEGVLHSNGVGRIPMSLGPSDPPVMFNPNLHECIASINPGDLKAHRAERQSKPEAEEGGGGGGGAQHLIAGQVVEETLSGWMLYDRVLRPSKVVCVANDSSDAAPGNQSSTSS